MIGVLPVSAAVTFVKVTPEFGGTARDQVSDDTLVPSRNGGSMRIQIGRAVLA